MWTFNALDDFCRFTNTLYAHHLNILRLKSQSGGMVVDMNLFWLWWVAHRRNSSDIWGNGNPFYSRNPQAFTQAIGFANSLHLPIVNGRSIRICNGMDVVDRAGKTPQYAILLRPLLSSLIFGTSTIALPIYIAATNSFFA